MRMEEDAAQSLKTYLYAGNPGDIAKGKKLDTRFTAKVVRVEGNRVEINLDNQVLTVYKDWQPILITTTSTASASRTSACTRERSTARRRSECSSAESPIRSSFRNRTSS